MDSFKDTIQAYQETIEDALASLLKTENDSLSPLFSAANYALLAKAKRLRPILVLNCATLLGATTEQALATALSLECLHTYSLIHDDLPAMDNSMLRRGQPSLHQKAGEANAILIGDGLLTFAFELVAEDQNLPAQTRCNLILLLSKASGFKGMVGGQFLDLAAEEKSLSLKEIEQLQALKTGCLLTYACHAGALIGQASPEQEKALITYGTALGRAFQIVDDLLDADPHAKDLGKPQGLDQTAKKETFVTHLGQKNAEDLAQKNIAEALSALTLFDEKADFLRSLARFVLERKH